MLIAEYLGVPREQFFAAMGQIDPLLLEEATPEEIERGLIAAHEAIRKAKGQVPTEQEVRERKYLDAFRRLIKGLEDEQVEAILKTAKSLSESFRMMQKEKEAVAMKAR